MGLALAKFTRFTGFGVIGSPGAAPTDLDDAQKLLQPLVYKPDSSRRVRLVYADLLNYISHRRLTKEEGIKDCEEARKLLLDLGARDLSDLSAASIYADTSDSQSRHALQLGRVEEAERLSREVYDIANKVLVQRPGDFRSMQNRLLAAGMLGGLAFRRHDYAAAAAYAAQSEEAAENYVRLNPSDLTAWDYLIRARGAVSIRAVGARSGRCVAPEYAWHRRRCRMTSACPRACCRNWPSRINAWHYERHAQASQRLPRRPGASRCARLQRP